MDGDNNSSVLITGGRGFIGRTATKLLQRTGYAVISLDTSSLPVGHDQQSVREVTCDIADAQGLQRAFEGGAIDVILHLAAVLPTAGQQEPKRATDVNIAGSVNLLEMARRFGVRRVIFGSSLSVYGAYAANRAVSETDRAAPTDLYGAAKRYVEQLGKSYRERYGLDFVSLRIGRVVGPGARSATSAWRSEIFELLSARQPVEISVPYLGSERVLLVHVEDVARMLVALGQAARPAHAIYNAPCETMTMAELKHKVEALNANVTVRLGEERTEHNPQALDSSRFQGEFGFPILPMAERFKRAAGK